MNARRLRSRLLDQQHLNFVLTNCLPRAWLTRVMGRLSKIERPWVTRTAIAILKLFSDLDLADARETQFRSLHHCFTRQLREGARPVDCDPRVLVSPSDGVVGACGRVRQGQLLQAKGMTYTLGELLGNPRLARRFEDGCYITLRLKSSMYHRFHAPGDCRIGRVTWFHGDVWNVNPPTLKRVRRVFARNERAVIEAGLPCGDTIVLVPVAAILVASLRLHFLDTTLNMDYEGPVTFACDVRATRGEELGWFEHGSTIIVLAPRGYALADAVSEGSTIRMGQPLLRMPAA